MAKRYDQKTKDEVVAYVQQFNEENGRGGQTAAVNKWNLNPITVKSWLEKAGVATPGRGGKKKRPAGRVAKKTGTRARRTARAAKAPAAKAPAKKAAAPAAAAVGGTDDAVSQTLQRMISIQSQIFALQSEYDELKGQI
ncbi:MAG: hypothetical protein GXX91_05975 [Verrucomicrobiaceae bacterium]|nr:hypothetical protein [Verrucomicrobiaceae bacterium]